MEQHSLSHFLAMAALEQSKDILIVVPSHAFGEILLKIRPHLKPDHRLIWATKGLERNTGRLLQEVVEETLGKAIPTAVLSGPTFAKELAQGLPTAITLASRNEKFALEFQARIHCSQHFRVYVNQDMIGVQLGGAIKAIGAGISDGMGFGANARTALITRGIAEITRLGVSMGANTQTFMGMSGLGDLVLTCTDNQSRNRRFGLMLGKGTDSQQAMDEIGQVVEGFYNTKETYLLAQRQGVEMPITEQIYQMLFCGKSAQEVALSLINWLTLSCPQFRYVKLLKKPIRPSPISLIVLLVILKPCATAILLWNYGRPHYFI